MKAGGEVVSSGSAERPHRLEAEELTSRRPGPSSITQLKKRYSTPN